jgi:hypothetical protein
LSAVRDELNVNVFGSTPMNFISERISAISMKAAKDKACDLNTLAYVHEGESLINICPEAFKGSTFSFMDILVHEARHIPYQNDEGYQHVRCIHGKYRTGNSFSCDPSYQWRGAYGVGVEFAIRLSRTKDIDPALRAEARSVATYFLLSRFNSLPLGLTPGVFAQTKDNQIYFIGEKNISPIALGTAPPNAILGSYFGQPMLFLQDNGEVQTFEFNGRNQPVFIAFAERFKSRILKHPDHQLVDVLNSFKYECLLFTDELECYYANKKINLALPQGQRAVGFFTFDTQASLAMTGGKVITLPTEFTELESINLNESSQNSSLMPLISAVALNEEWAFAVSEDGLLKKISLLQRRQSSVVNSAIKLQIKKLAGPGSWTERPIEF